MPPVPTTENPWVEPIVPESPVITTPAVPAECAPEGETLPVLLQATTAPKHQKRSKS
jgi:hypothetical protein